MVRVYAKSPDTYFEDGGANMQPQQTQQQMPQIDQEQLMQLIQMFAQITGNDPQQIMQQLQQLPPEQQMQAIQQMAQAIQSQEQAPQQGQMQQAPQGMPPGAAEEMPVGEDTAMNEMGGGEEMMAPPMMFGGMTGYAKTNKKLLKKAMGGANTNVTYQTEQERIGQKVNSAIGNNFVNSLIDQATDRFGQRAPQMQTNFAPGGAFTNEMFNNPYLTSANAAIKSTKRDLRDSQYLFNERLEDLPGSVASYVEMTGRAKGSKDADGNRYGILNRRPKFVQRDYTPGASIENSIFSRDGGDINASMAFYKNGGYTTIPIMGMFQDAGQVPGANVNAKATISDNTKLTVPHSGPSSMEEVIQLSDAYRKRLALLNDPTAVVGFANPNPGFAQDSIFYYPGQTSGNFTPYQIGRDRNYNVLYGVSDNPPSLDQMVRYGNTTRGEAGVGLPGNKYIDIAGRNTETRHLPMYEYSGRPGVLYMKDPNGKWLINLKGDKNGEFTPIKDPEGKRTKELNKNAYRSYKNGGYLKTFQDGDEVAIADVNVRDAQGNERMVTEAEAEMWQNKKAQDPNASLDDLSFASQAPGYKGTFQPKSKGKANYDEEEEKKNDPGYVDLKWRGNLDKATENLYLKDSDIRTGFFNRNNIRRAKFTFGERGMGDGAGALGATGAGQTSGNYTNDKGDLVYGNNSGTNFRGDYSDEALDRMEQRGQRQAERNADRYYRQTGDYLDMSIDQPNVQQSIQPNVQNTQSMNSPMGYSAEQAQYLMNNQSPSITGNYSDQFQPNFGVPSPMMTPEEAAAYVSQMQFRNGGYYLPQAIDGIDENMSEEDKFQIKMKEKSGLLSASSPLIMAGINVGLGGINAARAKQQKNDAFNVALNTPTLAGDYVGGLGSFTNTTGPYNFMQNLEMGMMPGRFGASAPAQQYGSVFGRNGNGYEYGGQTDLSQYAEGGDYWMTKDEVEQLMKMGGKVEYY